MQEIEDLKKLRQITSQEASFRHNLEQYSFLVWDGFRFFGFAFDKLPRLRGHKPSFTDKFNNRKLFVTILLVAIVTIWVVVEELSQLGKVKRQQIKFEDLKVLNVTAYNGLPLVTIIYFNTLSVIDKLKHKNTFGQNTSPETLNSN